MLAQRALLLLIVAIGLLGAWTLRDAAGDYTGAIRAYTSVRAEAGPGSFAWTAPDFASGALTLTLVNDSTHDATAESVDMQLRFDGDFAGSNYVAFTPTPVPAGETRVVTIPLTVTVARSAARLAAVDVSVDGTIVFRFVGIQHSRAVEVAADFGRMATP